LHETIDVGADATLVAHCWDCLLYERLEGPVIGANRLAQFAVGLTHLARGNRQGASALFLRGRDRIAG
jgi:hypothetical protein